MAQYNDEIILNIRTNYATAVNEIVRLTNELGKLKADMDGVRQAQKNKEITDDEANKRLEAMHAEYRKLNATIRSYRKEIDANLEAEEASNGSLKEMRAQLKNLLKQYDALSQVDREAIGGVGEQKLLEIRRLQEELKQAEEASGRFQRSVGSYEDAIKRALAGTMPMRQAMRELKTEIQTTEFQYRQMGTTIKQREQELVQLGQAVGTDTEDYKQQAAELEKLKQQYDATGKSLNDMKVAAGQMDDAMKDASKSIANFGADNANLKAMTQGAQLLLNGYTALKAGMTALGIESEELYNIFSKIQILQQGLNAVTQIANMLEKQSVLSQQARVLWTTLTTTSIASLTAAKKKDAVASAEAAAGDTALAAGEAAATAAAGGLTVALKAVGTAIKSIPIIGWIAAAVAALATLTVLIVRASKASKDNNETLRERIMFQRQLLELERQALESVKQQEVQLRYSVQRIKELEAGTDAWKREVSSVADALGVDAQWLQENIDKVNELTDAWLRMKTEMAKGEAYTKQIADNEIKIAQAKSQIDAILASTDQKNRVEALKQELGMTQKMAEKIAAAFSTMRKSKGAYVTVQEYNKAINDYTESLQNQNKILEEGRKKAYEEASDAQDELNENAADGIRNTGRTAVETAKAAGKEIVKSSKELQEELEDLMVAGMADGLEKNIKQVEVAAERYIEKMKEARDKDAKNKDKYDEIILQYEKNTQEKIRKMRADGYQTILASAEKLTESYNKLWASYAPNSFYNFVNDLAATADQVSEDVRKINKEILDLQDAVKQYQNTASYENVTAEGAEQAAKNIQEEFARNHTEIEIPVKPVIVTDNEAIRTAINDIVVTTLRDSGFSEQSISHIIEGLAEQMESIVTAAMQGEGSLAEMVAKSLEFLVEDAQKMGMTAEDAESYAALMGNVYQAFLDSNQDAEQALADYQNGMAKLYEQLATDSKLAEDYAVMQTRVAEAEKAATEARRNEVKATENLEVAKEKLEEKEKNYMTTLDESILKNRALTKSVREYAQTIQQVLLEQAKLGNISVIPDNFQVYIDYQIDKLEEELAKAYRKMENMALSPDIPVSQEARDTYNSILEQLKALKEARKSVGEDLIGSGATGGFFDNQELLENEVNIKRVSSQIEVLKDVISKGGETEKEIASLENENNALYEKRIKILAEIGTATTEEAQAEKKAELQRADNAIAKNNQIITDLKQSLALMGYTTDEEMDRLLQQLEGQLNAFSSNTSVIMKKTAASVVQSIGTMASSLSDLMNAIGEDNAEMSNFLEMAAYAQIGVNMAVGISEAIAAGAGVAFPANLAAIATGVAAVVSGMASAISTYKKYHQEVNAPKFAQGGYVSGEKGVDKIPAWLSDGEYVIKRKRVQELGIPFLDALNGGKSVTGRTHYSDGGYVASAAATQMMVNEESRQMLMDAMSEITPVVSVREITKAQNRVRAAERASKR